MNINSQITSMNNEIGFSIMLAISKQISRLSWLYPIGVFACNPGDFEVTGVLALKITWLIWLVES
jgi:hypothetical protein